MKSLLLLFALASVTTRPLAAEAHLVIPLWPNGAPGSEARKDEPEKITGNNVSNIHHPSLRVFLPAPEKATGCAIVVCPGGGHKNLSYKNEGLDVAQWLADHGIAAFLLKYRLGLDDATSKDAPQAYKWDVQGVSDGQRALRLVRSRAQEWGINPAALGIIGFSAGGEIVAQCAIRAEAGQPDATDPIERQNSRPDFQGLIYPGKSPLIIPTKDSPPAFLACGFKDRPDIAEGLASTYLLFKRAGVPADFHVFAGAGHGFGAREIGKSPAGEWVNLLRAFLVDQKFIAKEKS